MVTAGGTDPTGTGTKEVRITVYRTLTFRAKVLSQDSFGSLLRLGAAPSTTDPRFGNVTHGFRWCQSAPEPWGV